MHGIQLADRLRALTPEVQRATSSRSHATTMLGTTVASWALSTAAACSDQTHKLERM
jgi:hypothetical protein